MFGGFPFAGGWFGFAPDGSATPTVPPSEGPIHIEHLERCVGPQALHATAKTSGSSGLRAKRPGVTNPEQI